MSEPVGQFAPGIYFGLPAEPYHADQALGGTDLNLLARDPVEFQYRRLNPPAEDTPALIRGSATHARCLEGKPAFASGFKVKPEKPTDTTVLDTMEDLREHAYGLGLDKLPRLKADLIDLIRRHDREVVIWEEIMRRYEADPRIGISADVAAQIEQTAAWMQADPLIGAVMADGTFVDGAPEVSIFWEEDGIRCKARLDYLFSHAIVDLKTFGPWRDQTIEQGAINAIVSYRYDLNAAHYLRGWLAAQEMWLTKAELSMFTYDVDRDAMRELCSKTFTHEDEPKWIWVFTKTIGAPQPLVLEWSRERAPMSFGAAEDEVRNALDRYRAMLKEFGSDQTWPPRHAAVILDDASWPPWFGRR